VGPLKEKCLGITDTLGPFERRDLHIASAVGRPFESKAAYLYITLLLGPIENKVLCTYELPRVAGGKCLACLPLLKHTSVYNPDNDLIWEYDTDWTLSASSDMSTFSPNLRM